MRLVVNGKMWRLLRSWYEGRSACVKSRLSMNYPVERGVKQGSVSSPALFLLVMDPLLRKLQATGLGLSVNSFYAGGADDIRTLVTSVESLEAQMAVVNSISGMEVWE